MLLESDGCHGTGFIFTHSRAWIPNLNPYPDKLHQPPDPFNPTLLPAIFQDEMDLATEINAPGIQPELFDSPVSLEPPDTVVNAAAEARRKNYSDEHSAPDSADEQANHRSCPG